MFDVTGKSVCPVAECQTAADLEPWWQEMLTQARARRAETSRTRPLAMNELEALARQVYEAVRDEASIQAGVSLPENWHARLLGELSGLGALLDLIADPSVEDVALNLHHL